MMEIAGASMAEIKTKIAEMIAKFDSEIGSCFLAM
jgi:hypothetical protein